MAKKKARALGINHVVLEVGDLDRALEFYGAIFEFSLRGKNDHNAFIDMGDQFIQLRLGRTQEPDGARHFGFVLDDRRMRRAGMDYVDLAALVRHDSWRAFMSARPFGRLLLLTTAAENTYSGHAYRQGDCLLFGRESAGVPTQVHEAADFRLSIPMRAGLRSINVANAAAMV